MQAITTRYLCPTNTKGSRIIAECEAGRHVHHWDSSVSAEVNHEQSARALATSLGWLGTLEEPTKYAMVSGTAKNQTGVHLLILRQIKYG